MHDEGNVALAGPQIKQGTKTQGPLSSPTGVLFNPHDGTLWVASYTASTIVRFNASNDVGQTRVWRVTD